MGTPLTPRELLRLFPNATKSTLRANCGEVDLEANRSVPNPEPEHHQKEPLGQAGKGKEQGLPGVAVRFIGYRVRPLDPDNFAGSCKDLLDGLRHMGAIEGDEPWKIRFETTQVRVSSFAQERTEIEIYRL